MNEIINIKRFTALTKLCYQENWKKYLLALMLAGLVAWMILTGGNPLLIDYRGITTQTMEQCKETGTIEHKGHQRQQYFAFWFGWVVLSVGIAFNELRKYNRKESNTAAFLIPASNTEKYALALINSAIVGTLAWICLFYGINWLVASYKYIFFISDGNHYNNSFLLWKSIPTQLLETGENLRPVLTNVFDLTPMHGKESAKYMLPGFLCGILWIQSLYMLGSLTFKRQAPLLILLTQLLIFFIAGYISYSIIRTWDTVISEIQIVQITTDQLDMAINIMGSNYLPKIQIVWLMMLFSFCHFWAAFQTFRNKQV